MFDIFFRWPKASKCKKTIKRARCRLRLLKIKSEAMVRYLRKELAELIHNGDEETAFKRGYILLLHKKINEDSDGVQLAQTRDCPDDINEAISSLIFASAKCADPPELRVIRKLFGQRYGHKYEIAAVKLYPGNLVNKQLIENLSVKSVPDDLKYKVVNEIARDNDLQPKLLAIEYYQDWQQFQIKEDKRPALVESDAKANVTSAGSKIHPLEVEKIERDVICFNSPISDPSDFALVSTVQQYPSYLSYPLQKNVEEVEDFPEIISYATSDLQNKGGIMALVPSSERVSLSPHGDALVDYVDDMDESQFSVSKDGSSQRDKIQFGYDESDMSQDESTGENSSIRSSRKSKLSPKKRSRRRSTLLKGQGIMDIGFVIYYHKPFRSPSAHKYGTHKRLKQHNSSEKEKIVQCQGSTKRKFFNFDMCDCSLDQPCYCCVYNEECLEDLSVKPKRGIRAAHVQQGVLLGEFCHYKPFWHDECRKGMELVTIPRISGSFTRVETEPPYSRALNMPLKSPKNCEDKILRTYSCPSPQPKHVHPKLPDYDEIVANFTSLKRERLRNKDCHKEQQLK